MAKPGIFVPLLCSLWWGFAVAQPQAAEPAPRGTAADAGVQDCVARPISAQQLIRLSDYLPALQNAGTEARTQQDRLLKLLRGRPPADDLDDLIDPIRASLSTQLQRIDELLVPDVDDLVGEQLLAAARDDLSDSIEVLLDLADDGSQLVTAGDEALTSAVGDRQAAVDRAMDAFRRDALSAYANYGFGAEQVQASNLRLKPRARPREPGRC